MSSKKYLLLITTLHVFCISLSIFLFINLSSSLPQICINELNAQNIATDDGRAISTSTSLLKNAATSSIIFVGDVMLARDVEGHIQREGGNYPFLNLSFLKNNQSYVVANFEASIPKFHKKTPNYTFSFSVDKQYLKDFSLAGFTHVSLANNHSLDNGKEGLTNTKIELTNESINYFGEPNDISTSSTISFLTLEDKKVAILGLNTILPAPDMSKLEAVLDYVTQNSNYQIIYIHWGEEYENRSTLSQREFAKQLANLGADIIIGHHPHVVEEVEIINNTMVFYSLGNFIFDQYFSHEVQDGLALELFLQNDNLLVNLLPVTSLASQAQPRLMNEQETAQFLTKLALNSAPNLKNMIASGQVYLANVLATSTEMAMMEL
jgi:poly-gamma-glutamate synthesis protein (capsule biosynthesis protein)